MSSANETLPSKYSQRRTIAVTIVRVGSNDKYASGWESAFGKKGKKSAAATAGGKKKPAKKKGKK
jgi:hypothetical protein